MSALYDGDALTKMKMAALCTMAVEELYMAQMVDAVRADAEDGAKMLTLQDRTHICHALARQIENSDANRSTLEQVLKQETFRARRIVNALAEF